MDAKENKNTWVLTKGDGTLYNVGVSNDEMCVQEQQLTVIEWGRVTVNVPRRALIASASSSDGLR